MPNRNIIPLVYDVPEKTFSKESIHCIKKKNNRIFVVGSLVCEVFQNNKFVPVAEACSYVAEIACESLGNKNKKSMVWLT